MPQQNHGLLIELCCGGIDDVALAASAGVDRIELNCAMPVGGLTPSVGLVHAARRIFSGPVIGMVRPREGGFCYSLAEFLQMLDDSESLLARKLDGLAVGFLMADGQIDVARCRKLRALFPNTTLVFHKAFDVTPDQETAMQQLIDCGFNRILTSAGMPTAAQGKTRLRALRELAGEHIEVLPGGGIRAGNVRAIVEQSGCNQIHSAVREAVNDSSTQHNEAFNFGLPGDTSGGYGRAASNLLDDLLNAVADLRPPRS